MIHVIATIEVNTGKRDAFLKIFRALMPKVHAEKGCIEYGPAIDAPASAVQAAPRANVVVILEKWSDLPALQAHLAAPHMNAYRAEVKDLVKGVTLQVLQPA